MSDTANQQDRETVTDKSGEEQVLPESEGESTDSGNKEDQTETETKTNPQAKARVLFQGLTSPRGSELPPRRGNTTSSSSQQRSSTTMSLYQIDGEGIPVATARNQYQIGGLITLRKQDRVNLDAAKHQELFN